MVGFGDVRSTNEKVGKRFAVIGTPVGHSLSPAIHNIVYRAADVDWSYSAIECPTEADALHQIDLVRMGHLDGINITMPYKKLAMEQADLVDASAVAAGGANVLVRRGKDLCAYNTDGLGAVDAIVRAADLDVTKVYACVCGTGPTSSSIACALAMSGAKSVTVFSRSAAKAASAVRHMASCLEPEQAAVLHPATYDDVFRIVPGCNVFVDATPRGMNPDDEPIISPSFFHEGQVVMDVVYAHGLTRIVDGAREQGAIAIDGGEMLVGQAALAIEIWQRELGYSFPIDRNIMRKPVLAKQA